MTSTLKDIARSLDLSPATVSRALNGFPEVNALTRARVEEQARLLGYRPNQLARKLVGGSSGVVALVVPHAENLAADSTFFGVVAGISSALAGQDMDLMLHVATGDDEVEPYRRLLSKGIVDGFIVNTPRPDDPRIAFLKQAGAAFVVHGRSSANDDYAYYDIDNHHVSVAAATLLCELGHRNIALVNGPLGHAFAMDRQAGFVDTLGRYGVPVGEAMMLDGPLTETHGYLSALSALGATQGNRPTAFICGSTQVAAGVLRAAADKGLSVPQDLSVIAHDDHEPQYVSAEMSPPLTVTSAPLTLACGPLAELILLQVKGNPEERLLQRRDRPTLILRKSVARPPDEAAR
jgi:LacI family transcriptional regulator